jgi:ribosomal protein S18 acetylase RimI-like enzyme
VEIRPFAPVDEDAVVDLWQRCALLRPWNDPRKDIQRKLTTQAELFLVGDLQGSIVATIMAGYDGHRGWVNYLAVDPAHRSKGYGRSLMQRVEELLTTRGCPKLNIQVRADNQEVLQFYRKIGYLADNAVSLGKRLIPDQER